VEVRLEGGLRELMKGVVVVDGRTGCGFCFAPLVVRAGVTYLAISGLRVAGASVMPSANTPSTVYAIAERAAEMIGGYDRGGCA
jgi:choline dehydrogenase-like flavoprotein